MSDSVIFANSRANNFYSSGPIRSIIKLIRDLMGIYIVASLVLIGQYLQMLERKQSNMANFQIQGQITQKSFGPIRSIIELIQDLMITYILTKFGAIWFIFVDDRV